ncbi:aminoglycoside 6-adenylyltransferase [Bacillus mycoides]|uniref:aminoglycoside 6-adenylyltransferase n=1 Tax=Bacillus mycoides TaxID=1405 RepID=UPI0023516180|nr:aminoglycoside 6-adenylyltransferase [Bacillus mycoides]
MKKLYYLFTLFRILSKDVAEYFNFTYPIDDDRNMTKYLKHVRNLPSDAKEIFQENGCILQS